MLLARCRGCSGHLRVRIAPGSRFRSPSCPKPLDNRDSKILTGFGARCRFSVRPAEPQTAADIVFVVQTGHAATLEAHIPALHMDRPAGRQFPADRKSVV